MSYTNDEIMKWQVKAPDGVDIVYTKDNSPVTIADMVREEEKRLRTQRLKSKRKKKAFNLKDLYLLHLDRSKGMSIRELARKYDKSTRTIQKYLKEQPPKIGIFKPQE